MNMRAAQLRYDSQESEPALDDCRVIYLHDLLDMLREELLDATQTVKDLKARIADITEELAGV